MSIEVTVDKIALDTVVEQFNDGDGEKTLRVADLVAEQIVSRLVLDQPWWNSVRHRVDEIRDEEIREALTPMIAEALTGTIQPTNRFGEARGAPTTLREMIAEEAKAQISRKPEDYRGTASPLQQVVAAEVNKVLGKEVREVVAKVRDQLGKTAGEAFVRAIQEGLAK